MDRVLEMFPRFLADARGRAVEYVLVTAIVGGLIVAAFQNPKLKALEQSLWENFFSLAEKKATL